MTLGMTIGFRLTLWMMFGELIGVGLIAVLAAVGVAAIMLKSPVIFTLLKYAGGLYLAWLGVNLWSKGKMSIQSKSTKNLQASKKSLVSQGFFTAISNPKGWAFFIVLLPPFINNKHPLTPQLTLLISLILLLEFFCLCLYAVGGGTLRHFLRHAANVRLLNRISGTMMLGVAAWLAFG